MRAPRPFWLLPVLVVLAACADVVGIDDWRSNAGGGASATGSTTTSASPECGNGALETGEECDDENALSGDGCSASCVLECALLAGDTGETLVYGGHCYWISATTATWTEAELRCEAWGGYLTTLSSRAEEDAVDIALVTSDRFWIGANDRDEDGVWTWIEDGSGLDAYSNWAASEPTGANELCVDIERTELEWNNLECEKAMPLPRWICEKPVP